MTSTGRRVRSKGRCPEKHAERRSCRAVVDSTLPPPCAARRVAAHDRWSGAGRHGGHRAPAGGPPPGCYHRAGTAPAVPRGGDLRSGGERRGRKERNGRRSPDGRVGWRWSRLLLAVFLPDLFRRRPREAATVAQRRVVSIVQSSPVPSEAPFIRPAVASASRSPRTASPSAKRGDRPPHLGSGPSSQPDGRRPGGPGPGAPAAATAPAVVQFIDGPYAGQEGQGSSRARAARSSCRLPPGDEVVVEIDTRRRDDMMVLIDRGACRSSRCSSGVRGDRCGRAGWRGLRAIAALALTLVLTLRLFVPAGHSRLGPGPLASCRDWSRR